MELKRRLAALFEVRPAWYTDLLTRIAARLNRTAVEGVLSAGTSMPDFVLPNAEGELVFSDDLLAQGPLVVTFFRGGWCPFCSATLKALQEVLPDILVQGATLVAISPDTAGHVRATKQSLGLQFELLSDVDNAVALRFGVVYPVPNEYSMALLSFGIDLTQRLGAGAHLLPMPAAFISDADGCLRYAYASGAVTDRTEPAAIVALLRSIRSDDPPVPGEVDGRPDSCGTLQAGANGAL
jgi:peroxiredoxin